MSKLLAIYGSPRENGRSDSALDILLDDLKNKRALKQSSTLASEISKFTKSEIRVLSLAKARNPKSEIEKLYIRNLNIKPCSGCLECHKDGICKVKDDMEKIIPSLISCDIIILSSPVYFKGLPSQLKAMIDRCQVLWERKIIRENTSYGFFILTCEKKGDFPSCIDVIKAFFATIAAKLIDGIIIQDDEPLENILKQLATDGYRYSQIYLLSKFF